jgi:hypothetical protein
MYFSGKAFQNNDNKMKKNIYHTVGTVPKSNKKMIERERGQINIPNTHIHDCLFIYRRKINRFFSLHGTFLLLNSIIEIYSIIVVKFLLIYNFILYYKSLDDFTKT